MLAGTDQDPLIGALLDGRYRIASLLGQGGMGNVYLAEETRLRRRCALKVLQPQLAQDRAHVERFLREAQTIAQFEHPNIVDIHSYGEEPGGVVFFAMELLTGHDLDARLKRRDEDEFTTHDCCVWAIQIARAVAVVHEAGLIHRDLKTSNIFLAQRRDGEEIVKLLDFGIARPEEGSELTRTGIALGTPSYMSPEQIRNLAIDRRADIYSFGILLYKLITGKLPFVGEPIQVAMQQCESPPPPPSQVRPEAEISPALEQIVLKAMAKQPSDRFQSMKEIEQALIAVLEDEAPEFAPQLRPSRITTQSGVGRRPTGNQPSVRPTTVPSPTLQELAPGDAATTPSNAAAVATAAQLASPPPRLTRWLHIITGASVLGTLALLAAVMLNAPDDAAPPAPAEKPAPAAAPPRGEPKPAPARPPASAPAKPPEVTAPVVLPVAPPVVAPPPVATQPPKPAATKDPKPAVKPKVEPKPEPAARPDPIQQVHKKAQACRRKHDAVDGPKITIDYAIGIDGKVTRSIPATADELGACLADAVRLTQFEPRLVLGKKIDL